MTRVRNFLVDVGPWPVGLGFMTFWLMAWSVLQAPVADFGIHVSVAERLIAGDRLYEEVWDNKDPLYFLTLAGARWISPLGGWFIQIASLAATSISVYFVSRRIDTSRSLAVLVGWVAAPIIVVGLLDPTGGVSPAVPATFAAVAFALVKRPLFAGLVLAAVPFFQIRMFPVALTVLVVVFWFVPQRRVRAGIGFGLGVLLVLAVLAFRQELLPYVNSLFLNIGYAQAESAGSGILAGRLVFLQNSAVQLSVLAIVLALSLARPLSVRAKGSAKRSANDAIWWAAAWCLPSIAVVLLVTGKWPGHAKVLLIPGTLAVVAVAGQLSWRPRYSTVVSAVIVISLGILIAAVPSPKPFFNSLEYARAVLSQNKNASTQAQAVIQTGPPASYARVGQGQDPAHAIGLRDWDLACPRITQYWWENESILESIRECLSSADVLLVTDDLYGPVTTPTWERFQEGVEEVLAENYTCSPSPGFRVCTKVV